MTRWTQADIELLKTYYPDNRADIATTIVPMLSSSRTVVAVNLKASSLGIPRRPVASRKSLIHQWYLDGISVPTIARKLGADKSNVYDMLRKDYGVVFSNDNGGPKYSRHVDEEFFDEINTEAKAYFLGLMYADGSVSSYKKYLTIALKATDGYLLEEFKHHIGYDGAVKSSPARGIGGPQKYLRISSRRLHAALRKHGCTPAKSLTLTYPTTVPAHLEHHFIRGYFDGDGTISGSCVGFCGTYEFLKSLERAIAVGAELPTGRTIQRNGKIHVLHINGINMALRIADYLYNGATVYMHRKRRRFRALLGIKSVNRVLWRGRVRMPNTHMYGAVAVSAIP